MDRSDDIAGESFLPHARRVSEWIADYLAAPERHPVLPSVRPGDLRRALPPDPPAEPEPLEKILDDVETLIVPALTHWNHPNFFAYFANSATGPAVLGEYLAAALNPNGMNWRSSPAATELELVTLDWLRAALGLPEGFFGVIHDTASTSTLVALAAARNDRAGFDVRAEGLAGGPRLKMYASGEAHSSVEKAGLILGLGQAGFERIPVDDDGRMDPDALAAAIARDRADGCVPFAVTATVGTTATAAVDPVPAIAEIAARHELWLHVDAAYAGSAACAPEFRWLLDGCERADSIVVNPHKWLFVPIDLSALYVREPEALRAALSVLPEYLRTPEDPEAPNLMDYGVSLGRRFRALKLWMTMRAFGVSGLARRIRAHVALAERFEGWLKDDPRFVVAARRHLSLVCFRGRFGGDHVGENALNEKLLHAVNAERRVFLSHAVVAGRFTLRLAIGNAATAEAHVRQAYDAVAAAYETVRAAS